MVKVWLPLIVALFASIVGVLLRGDAFWCSLRSLPLATRWRTDGFDIGKDMPDLVGRTALVTGANAGLGRETALQLALANATVIMACRSTASCEEAAAFVRSQAGNSTGRVEVASLDLGSLQSTDALCQYLRSSLQELSILVLNAGVATVFPVPTLSVDGVEMTFQANFLGHFHVTTCLLPLLLSTAARGPKPTVIHLSSGAHRAAPPEGVPLSLEVWNNASSLSAYARYGTAKLANLVFSYELSRRAPQLHSCALHPGVVATSMLREANFQTMLGTIPGTLAFWAAKLRNALFAYTPQRAVLTVLRCLAIESSAIQDSQQAEFFVPVGQLWEPRHPKARDLAHGAALWDWSLETVRVVLNGAQVH